MRVVALSTLSFAARRAGSRPQYRVPDGGLSTAPQVVGVSETYLTASSRGDSLDHPKLETAAWTIPGASTRIRQIRTLPEVRSSPWTDLPLVRNKPAGSLPVLQQVWDPGYRPGCYTAALQFPRVVYPPAREHNYLLNPTHPDFRLIRVGTADPFSFDPGMWKG